MHTRYPQMGCSDGQMGYYDRAMGAVIYDEQQGGQMGADTGDIVNDFLKRLLPSLSSAAVASVRNSEEGKKLEETTASYLQYMSREQAAQALAENTALWQIRLSGYMRSAQASIAANWQKYLLWTGMAVAVVAVTYFFIVPQFRGSRAVRTASNPRYRRNARKARKSRARRRK